MYYIKLLGNERVSVISTTLVNYFKLQFPCIEDGDVITTSFSRIAIWIAWDNAS